MRDDVFDVPIGQLQRWVRDNEREWPALVGVMGSRDVERLILQGRGEGAVGRWLVVESYAKFGNERYAGVNVVRDFETRGAALAWAAFMYQAGSECLYDEVTRMGHDYEVWHVVPDPVPVVPAGSDGVFDVSWDQFVKWCVEFDDGLSSDALTGYPDRGDLVYRSRGLCGPLPGSVSSGKWYRVYCSATFGCVGFDVYAVPVSADEVVDALRRDGVPLDPLWGVGYEVEYWHVVDGLPSWDPAYDPRLDQWDDHCWDERPEPAPVSTWHEIDIAPEVV